MSEPEHSDAPTQEADGKRRRRRRWLIGGILVIFVLGLIGYGAYWFLIGQFHVVTEDAYVGGNRLMLTPQIADTVIAIAADDTNLVQAGQAVVTLDHSNQSVALNQAEADLGMAVRRVRKLRQQERAERATIAIRKITLAQAGRDYERDKKLLKLHGVTLEAFQHAQTAYDNARQQLAEAQHTLAALQTQTEAPSLRETPSVALAISRLQQAWLNLKRTTIPAPATGYIAQRNVQIGERVTPGQKLLAIVPLDEIWVDANFKETQLADVRIGQPVTLTADLYGGGLTYHGHIVGISAGTGAAFELLPPQNATGNWIKIVRRVPVRIALDPKELEKNPLRIGLSMHVDVDVKDTRGPALAKAPPAKPVYATDVYDLPRTAFETLVERILQENGAGSADADHLHSSGREAAR